MVVLVDGPDRGGGNVKRPAVFLGVLVVGLSACGQQKLNTDRAEKAIAQGITQQTGAQGVSVTCPDDVKVKAGSQFYCQAKAADGRHGRVRVTQKDDKGNIDWKLNP
jgi:Domain of unknown function (DUF4333)